VREKRHEKSKLRRNKGIHRPIAAKKVSVRNMKRSTDVIIVLCAVDLHN